MSVEANTFNTLRGGDQRGYSSKRKKKGKKTVLNKEKVDVLNVLKVKASQGSAVLSPHPNRNCAK